ncbi:MAG: large-conductance mechanosensitive channel protein MscL [Clostridia bacterium]|nr:large-conductance mechanosensitive channel protein MscL [Clostridia bacterium]
MIAEFKEFISRGNVIDLAVGVIIGGAFTAIVNSLVNDVVMPFIGWLIGGINFTDFKAYMPMREGLEQQAVIAYGSFIQNVINFLLVAIVIFSIVKIINAFRKKKEEEPEPDPEPSDEVKLLTEIRDLLDK